MAEELVEREIMWLLELDKKGRFPHPCGYAAGKQKEEREGKGKSPETL